jgi:hypothetical protein
MKMLWISGARMLVVAAVSIAVVFGLGCRKSKTQRGEEQREEVEQLQERKFTRQETEAADRQQYDHAKALIAQRKYDEAWKELEEVAARNDKLAFEFDLYKNEQLPAQLFRVAEDLSSVEKEQFSEAYRALAFVRDHIEKKRPAAEKRISALRHLKQGHDLYKGALQRIDAYQHADAIRMLEEVCNNYKDTPYYDKAVILLKQLKPPEQR